MALIVTCFSDIVYANTDVIVVPVSCTGFRGRGLACEFALRYPVAWEHFAEFCDEEMMFPGVLYPYELSFPRHSRTMIFFPTKDHHLGPAKLEYIEQGMESLGALLQNTDRYATVSIPQLGCGGGGLCWEDVHPIIARHLQSSDLADDLMVELYVRR